MTKPTKTIRRETGLIEAVCEHGVGHPVYGSAHWLGLQRHDTETWLVHGCDGCCQSDGWQIATLTESVERANEAIWVLQQILDGGATIVGGNHGPV